MSAHRAQAADDKTLRLAAPDLNPANLEAFLCYQRALRDRLHARPVSEQERGAHLAQSHLEALTQSGLGPREQGSVAALAAAFCARRSPALRIQKRLPALQGGTLAQAEVALRAAEELASLEDLGDLRRRYGEASVALLIGREEELLALHEEVSSLLLRS